MPQKSKTPAPIAAELNVSEAFAVVMDHNYRYLMEWEDTAKSWDDIEGVHQFRVTIRRMRSALSLFRGAIPKQVSKHWADEMRWLASELGLARDLDVFISEGLCHTARLPLDGAGRLKELAEKRRAKAYEEQVRAMLEGERYQRFKEAFPDWYEHRRWEEVKSKKKHRDNLEMKVTPFARSLLDKQERRVLSAGSHVDRDNPTEMHRLRIECKKLRYAAEFFRPIFAGMDTFMSHMKGLQDLLGLMNDVAVMQGLLDELLAHENDHEALVYAGGLVGWRTCDFYHMLDRFDGYWEEFTEAKHPWWKKAATLEAAQKQSEVDTKVEAEPKSLAETTTL